MHAGDALWFLYAGLDLFERRSSDDPRMLVVVQRLRECARELGRFMSIPEPTSEKMDEIINRLEYVEPEGDMDPSESEPPPCDPPRNRFSDPDNIEFARTLLDAMEASGSFDWSEFVMDLHAKIHDDDAFFTPRQWRGILRTARSQEEFWDEFEADNPECVKYALEQMDLAGD